MNHNLQKTQLSPEKIRDIEAHCRRVHAEAVIESFQFCFSRPAALLARLISARRSKEVVEKKLA